MYGLFIVGSFNNGYFNAILFSGLIFIFFVGVTGEVSAEKVSIAPGSSSPSNNLFFNPTEIFVSKGTTVSWTNDDVTLHTVTSGSPEGVAASGIEFDSSYMAGGKTFVWTFKDIGKFDYYCTLHPFMKGSINVVSNLSNSPTLPSQDNLTNNTNSQFNISKTSDAIVTNTTNGKYTNYTSTTYQIQFSYPRDWQVDERAGRFDEGTDLQISGLGPNTAFILIQYGDDPLVDFGSNDFTTAFYRIFKDTISGDYSYEYRVIEQPTFMTIDGQKAGTFLYTFKEKYEDNAWTWGSQVWIVYVGDHAYMLSFNERVETFDSQENIELRDQLINSIKFMGNNTNSTNNGLGRFA